MMTRRQRQPNPGRIIFIMEHMDEQGERDVTGDDDGLDKDFGRTRANYDNNNNNIKAEWKDMI